MTFILETGAGVPGANSYVTPEFITEYLTDRARLTENGWDTAGATRQRQASVVATQYLEGRFGGCFRGSRKRLRIEGRPADGTISFSDQPADTETLTIGSKVYRFVAALGQENDVVIGATLDATLASLLVAVNSGGAGDPTVHVDTVRNLEAMASLQGAILVAIAFVAGESGNEIAFASDVANASIEGSGKLRNGIDTGPQPLSFPRSWGFSWPYGGPAAVQYEGVPLKVKQATAEYAVRSLASKLDPDPVVDDLGRSVVRKREKFDVFEEETEYDEGSAVQIHRPYPAADALLEEFLRPAGVYR